MYCIIQCMVLIRILVYCITVLLSTVLHICIFPLQCSEIHCTHTWAVRLPTAVSTHWYEDRTFTAPIKLVPYFMCVYYRHALQSSTNQLDMQCSARKAMKCEDVCGHKGGRQPSTPIRKVRCYGLVWRWRDERLAANWLAHRRRDWSENAWHNETIDCL